MFWIKHTFGFEDFAAPARLWIALLAFWPLWRSATTVGLAWPFSTIRRTPRGWVARLAYLPDLARASAIVLLAVALAEPRSPGERIQIVSRGVAIVVALDRSSSMTAKDAEPTVSRQGARPASARTVSTRLEGAKSAFERFVVGRPDDAIGLIAFANYPDLLCPPTLDHRRLIEAVRTLRPVPPGDDGTNLGHAIVKGLATLLNVSARKRILILLTDGNDDPAVPKPIAPETAAKLARDLNVSVHAIALGRVRRAGRGDGPDLKRLERIAQIGGGRAFAASDSRALEDVFRSLDALEKSSLTGTIRTKDKPEFQPFALAALGCLTFDLILGLGRWKRLP